MKVEKGEIITLSNNKEYVCLGIATSTDHRTYLCLMTTSEPLEVCFAEEVTTGQGTEMRIIGSKEEKHQLLDLFKSQLQTNSNQ